MQAWDSSKCAFKFNLSQCALHTTYLYIKHDLSSKVFTQACELSTYHCCTIIKELTKLKLQKAKICRNHGKIHLSSTAFLYDSFRNQQ